MKTTLVLTLALVASTATTQAFHVPTRTTTPTVLDAAISPRDSFTTTTTSESSSSQQDLVVKRGEVVLDPYFGIPNGILGAVPLILFLHTAYFSPDGTPSVFAMAGAAIHVILGWYIHKQTQRVRCVFDKKSFEFKNIKGNTLVTKPNKNYVKGTINKWDCNTVVDFGYVPSKSYPLITWFKETDTPANQWGEYGLWGKIFTNPSPTSPAIHFFPGFIDIDAWETEMRKRGAKQASEDK